MAETKKRLVNITVKNIAAVGRPANRRSFLVTKSAEPKSDNERREAVANALREAYPNEGDGAGRVWLEDIFDGEAITTLKRGIISAIPFTFGEDGAVTFGEPYAVQREYVAKRREGLSKNEAAIAVLVESGEGAASLGEKVVSLIKESKMPETKPQVTPPTGDPPAPTSVSTTEFQAALKKSEEQREELIERLQKSEERTQQLEREGDLRKTRESLGEFKDIGIDPTKDAELFLKMERALSEDEMTRLHEVLRAQVVQKQEHEKSLFGEAGSSGAGKPSGETAVDIVNQRVDDIVSKSDGDSKPSRIDAQAQVFADDAALYERWRRETSIGYATA